MYTRKASFGSESKKYSKLSFWELPAGTVIVRMMYDVDPGW